MKVAEYGRGHSRSMDNPDFTHTLHTALYTAAKTGSYAQNPQRYCCLRHADCITNTLSCVLYGFHGPSAALYVVHAVRAGYTGRAVERNKNAPIRKLTDIFYRTVF